MGELFSKFPRQYFAVFDNSSDYLFTTLRQARLQHCGQVTLA
jgi:hypothetical protein